MASDDTALTEEAVASWHELVHSGALDENEPALRRLRSLTVYGEHRVCTVVRPNLVTRPKFEAERLAVALVASALAKACAFVSSRPELLGELGVGEAERELLLIDPGFENYDVNDRFDGFVSKRLGFVEAQGASPGGIGYHDAIVDALNETALLERFAGEYRVEPLLVVPALREALLSAWRDFGGEGDPVVAIVDWEDAPLMPEFELIRDGFEGAGLRTLICDPRRLRLESGELRLGGERIDVVYRRLTLIDTLERPDDAAVLVGAAQAGAVCLVNPFASDLMGHKSLFEIVGDPELDLGLSHAERNAVAAHVPFSRVLVSKPRPHSGQVRPEYAVEHRGELVLKPSHELGGHGVSLGWKTEPAEWERLVGEACDGGYIVQHRIREHHEPFAVDEPGFPVREFYVDNDPYSFRGKAGGINRRAYDRWVFDKRLMRDVADPDLSTTVMGTDLELPVLLAPWAFHRMVHPDGELATAAAAKATGSAICLSTLSSTPLEEVAATGVDLWLQIQIHKDRELTTELVRRAEDAGFKGFALTVDAPNYGVRPCDKRKPHPPATRGQDRQPGGPARPPQPRTRPRPDGVPVGGDGAARDLGGRRLVL